MNTQDLINKQRANREALLKSKLLAKAAIKMPNGSLRILAVYSLSTLYEFYWVHQTKAKTGRAPQKGWSKSSSMARDFITDYKPYDSFETFVAYYLRVNHATLLSLRVYQKRRLAAVYKKVDHDRTDHDWNAGPQTVNPRDFRYQNRKLQHHIKGRVIDPGWGK